MIIQCVCNIYLYLYIIHSSYEQVQNVEVMKGSERFLCFGRYGSLGDLVDKSYLSMHI